MLELKSMKSGWRAAFKSQEELDRYKKQMIKACWENRVNTQEQLDRGLAKARIDESDFFPSVGKFIKWCKPPQHHEHLAMAKATREFNANQKLLEHKNRTPEVGKKALEKIKEMLGKKK